MENSEIKNKSDPKENPKNMKLKKGLLIGCLGCFGFILLSCILLFALSKLAERLPEEYTEDISVKKATPEETKEQKAEEAPSSVIEKTASTPALAISTVSQIVPFKKILQKRYKDNFEESTIGSNEDRIMWFYETESYNGFISFDIIPTQQENILISTFNFQIYPEIEGKTLEKTWEKADGLISKWIMYFSGDVLKSEDILPLYYSTLSQAEKNYKKIGMSFRFNTFNVKSFEVKITCDIIGIVTIDLKRIE